MGVRRGEVLSGEGEAGMLSEWEVSFLGFKKRVLSALEEAETLLRLRWTHAGPVEGWGGCSIEPVEDEVPDDQESYIAKAANYFE